MKNTLDVCRDEINEIDAQLHALYQKRLAVSRKVGVYKKSHGLAVLDQSREDAIKAKMKVDYAKDADLYALLDLHETMMRVSRNAQYQTEAIAYVSVDSFQQDARVGYQGTRGSFSEIATQKCFPENQCCAYETFADVFQAVIDGTLTYGVVPLENSTHGEIVEVFDLLRDCDVSIVGEIIQPIEHCLVGLPGACVQDITTVYSHPQALAQSIDYLQKHPKMKQVPSPNTALSAQMISQQGDVSLAAIASKEAAQAFQLEVLETHLETYPHNKTRFAVIAKKQVVMKDAHKTSLLVTIDHKSGTLAKVVAQFQYEGVNMLKMTSRPIPSTSWRYQFFIDFEGSLRDHHVQTLLYRLSKEVYALRVLGSYETYE